MLYNLAVAERQSINSKNPLLIRVFKSVLIGWMAGRWCKVSIHVKFRMLLHKLGTKACTILSRHVGSVRYIYPLAYLHSMVNYKGFVLV